MIASTLVPAHDLSVRDLHDLLQLRSNVFVLEQDCAYADVDGRDLEPYARHVLIREDDELIGCARSLGPTPDGGDGDWRIGRVAVALHARRRGIARQLLTALLDDIDACVPGAPIRLDAQLQAEALYASARFVRVGDVFLDDGIEHVTMRRNAPVA